MAEIVQELLTLYELWALYKEDEIGEIWSKLKNPKVDLDNDSLALKKQEKAERPVIDDPDSLFIHEFRDKYVKPAMMVKQEDGNGLNPESGLEESIVKQESDAGLQEPTVMKLEQGI